MSFFRTFSPPISAESPPTLTREPQRESPTPLKKRKRVELTTITADTKVIEKKEKAPKKRKRARLFMDEEEDAGAKRSDGVSTHSSPVKSTDKSAEKSGTLNY